MNARYRFSIMLTGTVDEAQNDNGEIVEESLDSIRAVVLESFNFDPQGGVKIRSHEVSIRDESIN